MTAEQVQAFAAVATFAAALCAVWATFRAPKIAAEFAEELRASTQRADEDRRMKLFVFTTLMQFRSQIANPQAVAALNLIDIVFHDAGEVREAWRHFLTATEEKTGSIEKTVERYLAIIEKMARELGLSANIKISDIQASYYPQALGHLDEAAYWETQDKLQRFRAPPSSSEGDDLPAQ